MPNKSWKQRERNVADFFHGQRNPLSGRWSRHTGGDVIHESLFIEVKLRKRHTVVTLWDKVKTLASQEGKVPVVCLCEKHRSGFWILVHAKDFAELIGRMQANPLD